MKYLVKMLLCLPLCLLIIQSSCRKNKEEPKVFTYGPYKFAAKVNGQYFTPHGDELAFVPPISIRFYRSSSNPANTNLYVLVSRTQDHELISIYIRNITGPGQYLFNSYTVGYPNQYEPPHHAIYESDHGSWLTNNVDTGYVDISEYRLTRNADNTVVKGTFYFKARSLNDGSVVEVTEGYFSKN